MSSHPNLVTLSSVLAARKAKDKDTDTQKTVSPSTRNYSGDDDPEAKQDTKDKAKLL